MTYELTSELFGIKVLGSSLVVSTLSACSQQLPASSSAEPAWLTALTPAQKTLFEEARKSFVTNDFAGAFPKLRHLHEEITQNDVITKITAEAAVNTGDYELASSLLDALLRGDPDDPQALSIRAHLYGQQHDMSKRDSVMDHLQSFMTVGSPFRQW